VLGYGRETSEVTMKENPVPKLQDEIDYAVEAFEDSNDRKPDAAELAEITKEAQAKVDEAQEAYDEWKVSGAFECEECGRTHYHHAPPACCRAHYADEDRDERD
jgi:DNA-directed RNA polymerase specialized sigma subunit